jgi:hypothetical protein
VLRNGASASQGSVASWLMSSTESHSTVYVSVGGVMSIQWPQSVKLAKVIWLAYTV